MAVSTQAPGFIFDATGKGSALTYDQMQKRRRVFDALMERQASQRTPQTIGEGLNALGLGIVAGIQGRQLRKDEEALGEAQKGIWGKLSALGASPGVSPPNFGAGAGYGSATGAISDASATPAGTIDAASALPASFLASVDRVEGGGDYDTLFGHSQKSGPFAGVRVSDMTIGQALDFSDPGGSYGQFVKGKVGRIATPMGRHQIVGTTLRNAAAEMGLDPSTPFNQQTQDGIAAHLARKRVASADTMGGKISALRSEWEGFKHVPDAELATIVMDLQNGGGMPAPAPSAPVQVASLDPSAGVAQATAPNARANASVSTMPSTPSDVPVPTPAASAREALERARATVEGGTQPYTGPALNDPNAMSSIAPMGMPGSTAATDASIQQYHAANGSAPMQYQVGQTGLGTAPAPGSVEEQRTDAIIAGDPERPLVAPVPTPRPGMQQPAGIPPQAVAASATAQPPVPYDPVNGTAMGGNTGAADAARAAYQQANGPAPAVQRIAQVMNERGIPAQAPQPADPVRSEAVQRVATAQQQGQAQGRFGQLMEIMMNPAASPEQKQAAGMLLERDQQFQTQQQARAFEMWKTRQAWGREDQRFAVEDRREDAKLRLEQEKAAREANQPIEVGGVLVDRQTMRPVYQAPQQPFTLQPGETRFDGTGNQIAAGGVKPGYRVLTTQEAGSMGLPKGSYQVSPEGKVEDIGSKGQTINVGGGENKQVFDAMAESAASARSAATGLNGLSEAKRALDAGIISGAGADWNLSLQKIGAALGVVDPTAIQNTETFRASIAPQVAAVMKATVGSANISNSDREFAEKAAGGSINLDAGSIRRLVDIMDRASRVAIQSHIERLDAVYPTNGQFNRERALFGIMMPDPLASPDQQGQPGVAPSAAAPSGTPAGAAPRPGIVPGSDAGQRYEGGVPVGGGAQPPSAMPQRATNPQTGQVIELRNGQWVPVQ